MSDTGYAECGRCHDEFYIEVGYEPTEYCNDCVHDVVDEQQLRIQELELRCTHLSDALRAANAIPNPVEAKLRELLKKLRSRVWELEDRLKPTVTHSCEIPGCITCNNPPDDYVYSDTPDGE